MKTYRTLEGFSTRRTSKGAIVVELDLEADPAKRDPLWQEDIRRQMPSEAHWKREFKRDWTVAAGRPYYPEFLLNPTLFVQKLTFLLDAPVYRGWDFGFRMPACVWSQYSPKSDRFWAIRELMPTNISTHAMVTLVRYLSGQEDESEVEKYPAALQWLLWMRKQREKDIAKGLDPIPAPPWFGTGCHFIDYSGPEALKRSATVEHEHSARTDAEVLRSKGVTLNMLSTSIEARETIMRKLLVRRRNDGLPGLFLDPACRLLINGFNGGISYPEATKMTPQPTQPKRDGFYEHIHDALNYTAINVVPKQDNPDGGRVEIPGMEIGQLDLKETRRSVWR